MEQRPQSGKGFARRCRDRASLGWQRNVRRLVRLDEVPGAAGEKFRDVTETKSARRR